MPMGDLGEQIAEASDEDSDAMPAGPVAESDSSSSQAAGEEPTPTPPADETPEEQPQDDASEEASQDDVAEAESAESPATEQEEPDAAPAAEEAEEPKAEKKKDVIPGADLEPIAVETGPGAPRFSRIFAISGRRTCRKPSALA